MLEGMAELRLDYSNRYVVAARRLGQRIGILRPLQRRFRRFTGRQPEAAFDRALIERVRAGDTVWDVGAHVGLYTVAFAATAGEEGKVVAFEPSPLVLPQLAVATSPFSHVVIVESALSDRVGEATFYEADTGSTTFHGLSAQGSGEAMRPSTVVRTERGETVAAEHPPNLIKVDVEGFELEVLRGLGVALGSSELHTVAVEVHFQTLQLRGVPDAPRSIVELLDAAGFDVGWTDPSHLIAVRHPG